MTHKIGSEGMKSNRVSMMRNMKDGGGVYES
jgi:hypothetical protein